MHPPTLQYVFAQQKYKRIVLNSSGILLSNLICY